MPLLYVKGDATCPSSSRGAVIAHCCNDIGKFGRGFAASVAKRWPAAQQAYFEWYRMRRDCYGQDLPLGEVQLVQVAEDRWVANLIGQQGLIGPTNPKPIRYEAIRQGLLVLGAWACEQDVDIACPRFGSGLAGGDWTRIEAILRETCGMVQVTVYDL